jgi:DNA-binding transcriptional LysR family regulator
VRLFHRTSRVLRLTREGEKFLAGAHRVIEAIDEAETGLGQSGAGLEASGVLRINCALLLAQHQLSPLIPEFLERHPAMRLEFVLSAAPLEPVENQIDVSFQSGSIPDSSRVARRDGAELAAHEIKGNIGSNSSELLRSFAVAGVGIARLSDMHVDSDIRAGRLVRVLEAFRAETEAPLYVVYASRRNLSVRVKAFLDFIAEKFGAPPLPTPADQAVSSTTLPVT